MNHVVDVIADDGMAGLSVRAVASRAGVAIGTVQHWFPTKKTMLLAAMDRIVDVASTALPLSEQPATPEGRLRAVVARMVPSSAQSQVARVWLAFAAHAVTDDEVRVRYEELWTRTQRALTAILAEAVPDAAASAIDDAAAELLALGDGLAISVLNEPNRMPRDRALSLVERRVDQILTALHG